RAEYQSLLGQARHMVAVRRQVARSRRHVVELGSGPHLELKTAYYKGTNLRLYARHIWPTEFSSKPDADRILLEPAHEDTVTVNEDGVERRRTLGGEAVYAKTSPRGSLFGVRRSKAGDRLQFDDDWAGDVRPLVGIDTSASMMQIMTVALGWRDAERA